MASKWHKTPRKDGRSFNPASKKKLEAAIRERQALDLRLKGYDYDEIGRRMKVSGPAVYYMLMRILDRWKEDYAEKVPQVRQMEIQRCDQLLKGLEKLLKSKQPTVVIKATAQALRISERRAALLGLDAPVKVNPVDEEGRTLDLAAFRTIVLEASPVKQIEGNGHIPVVTDATFEEVQVQG